MKFGIHWFRRDLRIEGNPGLQWSWKKNDGRVLGIFLFDSKFLARPDFSVNRFQFFIETLTKLKSALEEAGSDILVLDQSPESGFERLFAHLRKHDLNLPENISFCRDYEPFARERDGRLTHFFEAQAVAVHSERDHLLIEPHEVHKGEDPADGYQVFTPFRTRWLEVYATDNVQHRREIQKKSIRAKADQRPFDLTWKKLLGKAAMLEDKLAEYDAANRKKVTISIPKSGFQTALGKLREFAKKIDDYGEARDIPGIAGTSQLSIYFKNGSLTVPQTIAELDLKAFSKKEKTGRTVYFSELIWREFYYHILARFPHVENTAFQTKYKSIRWENRDDYFEAWKTGQTGYPIVDAGMRQLNTTGWMHNRVRMIVASFLTKDLLVDYKWGERYFMEQLLDGDLAPNNGGWQWAASTGCDPQPYFRIFNPVLQSEKFDPDGTYIKHFIPELRHLDAKKIHCPGHLERGTYPQPIVLHEDQRPKALALYKSSK